MESASPTDIARALAEQLPPLTPNAAAVEADRCLYCYDAPCTHACPTHIDIPRFIKKIASENLRGSAETIFASNLLGCDLRARLPSAGVVRGRVRLGRRSQAHLHRTPAALRDGLRTRPQSLSHRQRRAHRSIDRCHRGRAGGPFLCGRIGEARPRCDHL